MRDLGAAMHRSRALFDLDSDPQAVTDALGADSLIGALVREVPGRRVAGHVDAHELAIRAVLGQQVSLQGASALTGRLVASYGEPLERPLGAVTHAFPSVETLAGADLGRIGMPSARRTALSTLVTALARGDITLDAGSERPESRQQLLALPGIGPWTVEYIAMRALRDPDAFLAGDLGVRHALEHLGHAGRRAEAERISQRWRPYRAYAVQHLWASLGIAGRGRRTSPRARGGLRLAA
jgi:AraC family transcriptional regulator of adaptative response / DNA-3-methyladenine glycosylase II